MTRANVRCLGLLACTIAALASRAAPATPEAQDDDAALRAMVREDWALQERRLGREAGSPQSIREALRRARLLIDNLRHIQGVGDPSGPSAELRELAARADDGLDALDPAARLDLYLRVRTLARELALRNPLVSSQPIVFMQRRRAVGYMLYEYLGWYYAHGNNPDNGAKNPAVPTPEPGGGVYVLARPGRSLATREVISGSTLGRGHFVTLSLSFDARTAYLAFADRDGADPYSLPGYAMAPAATAALRTRYNTFHILSVGLDGTGLRRLTDGPYDDFDPCPLPDGGIAFQSTRRGSKLRCGGGSPELVNTLHRMDADGGNVRTLSFHETNEWHPAVLNDGRIVYTRWDYVDRNAANFHGLWTCNPDGTAPAILFGNYARRPWACYQAKAVPGSDKVLFIAGAHHGNVGGTLVMLDPSRIALDPRTGEDRPEAMEVLTPEIRFPEADGFPKSYFYSPWPLSEDHYLVAFSHDPLCGGYTGQRTETETGLYYLDRFGNLELLFRRKGISAVYPIPLAPRSTPPVRGGGGGDGSAQAAPDEEGEFLLSDVRQSLLPLPAGRRITRLRVFQLLPKSRTDGADSPLIGHPSQANARMLLGTVPVEADGSAYFRAPARRPLYFQAVDESGRAVQGMRTTVYLQPGERRACVGCHERPGTVPASGRAAASAFRRPPSTLEPGPEGSRPFGFPRLVQPVLDRHCVRCHDGSAGPDKAPPDLTGAAQGPFSRSYEGLKPYVRWPSYDAAATRPGEVGADLSPLSAILTGERHARHVRVPDEALRTLYLWLDALVPFYGTYEEEGQSAQRRGRAVPPPPLQ